MMYHSWAEIQLPSDAFAYKKIQTSIIQTRAYSVLFTPTWGAAEAGLRERRNGRPNVPSSLNNASITSHRWGLNAALKSSRYSDAVKNARWGEDESGVYDIGCRVNPPVDGTYCITGFSSMYIYVLCREKGGNKWGAMQGLNKILAN